MNRPAAFPVIRTNHSPIYIPWVMDMSDSSLALRFQVGVLKELHERELITKAELDRAIREVKKRETDDTTE